MELKGKVIDFLGDSITEGYGVQNVAANRFDNVLKESAALKAVHNYGVGGSRIAHQRMPSEKPRWDLCFCGRAYDMDPSADIIVVLGGTNDYGHGDAPFGQSDDHTPATFCGAVNFLMDFLKTQYPRATIVFMTPSHRNGDANPSAKAQTDKRPLAAYVDHILAAAKQRGIATLDLFRDLPIDPNRAEDREKYSPDGLHLNDAGHRMVAATLEAFLKKL